MWTVEHDLDQIDYIDSCAAEDEDDEVRQPRGLDKEALWGLVFRRVPNLDFLKLSSNEVNS